MSSSTVRSDSATGAQDVTVDQETASPRTIDVRTGAGDVAVRYP